MNLKDMAKANHNDFLENKLAPMMGEKIEELESLKSKAMQDTPELYIAELEAKIAELELKLEAAQ